MLRRGEKFGWPRLLFLSHTPVSAPYIGIGGSLEAVLWASGRAWTARRPQFQNTVVWAKPTISASVVLSAGARKQEDWFETTRHEAAVFWGTTNRTGEC